MPTDAPAAAAGWPDVALAALAFAREDPAVFVGVILGILVPVALTVWFLLPRATKIASHLLARELEEHERQLRLPMPRKDDEE